MAVENRGFTLLPPREGVCHICAVDHLPSDPHDALSLNYKYHFLGRYGRWPTWQDAISHCDKETKTFWKQELQRLGEWTESNGVPDVMPADDGSIGLITKRFPDTNGDEG